MSGETYPHIDNLGPSVVLGPELFGCITPDGLVWTIAYRGVWYTPLTSPGADIPDALKPLDPGLFPKDWRHPGTSEAMYDKTWGQAL